MDYVLINTYTGEAAAYFTGAEKRDWLLSLGLKNHLIITMATYNTTQGV